MTELPQDLSHARWRKSTRSQGEANTCVEVTGDLADIIAVRDSKDPDGPKLVFDRSTFRSFAQGLKQA